MIDTHCHLYIEPLKEDLPNILQRAKNDSVDYIICPGLDINTSQQALDIAEKHANVFAAVGIHPHEADAVPNNYLEDLRKLASYSKVVAIGEIGLDYYRNYSEKDNQLRIFNKQLELAQELQLPVIIHNRAADDDILKILKSFAPINGVSHCFSSDLVVAQQLIEFGLYVSFAGNLTYKNSNLPDIAKKIPIDKLLIETDSPYLSPQPFRGKTNEPSRARIVAEKLAEIIDRSTDEIDSITTQNAKILFNFSLLDD